MSALEAHAESVDGPVQLSVAGVAKRFGGVTATRKACGGARGLVQGV